MKITRRQLRKIIKEASSYSTRGPSSGPFAEIWPYFEERGEGWQWKTKSSAEGVAFLPIRGSDEFGYIVKISYNRGMYEMSWIKRIELPSSGGMRAKVIRPQNGWTVESVPNKIKTAVDEINYDITKHEATTDSLGMDR